LKVNIVYLNHQGKENIAEVVGMFSLEKGPLKFELLEIDSNSAYFQLHRQLEKISLDDLNNLSERIREDFKVSEKDFVVIVTSKSLVTPTHSFQSPKDWYSFYSHQNIIVKSGGWDKITEGKPYLGIAHQIIENIFQNLGNFDLYSMRFGDWIHKEIEVCVNDFCEKPNETKSKIRSGHICKPCTSSALNFTSNDYVIQIKNILVRIGNRINENYQYDFTPEQLTIKVSNDYDISIGGQLINFGHKGKRAHVIYLFYLINNHLGIGKKDLTDNGKARKKFIALYNHLYKKIFDDDVNSYVNNITSVHSRISTLLKNTLTIESLAHKYGFSSKKIDQDVSVYSIEVSKEHLIYPSELEAFILQ
jgi:hypothetical protein